VLAGLIVAGLLGLLTRLIVAGPGWRVPWSPGRLTR